MTRAFRATNLQHIDPPIPDCAHNKPVLLSSIPPPHNSVNIVPTQYWYDDASAKFSPNTCNPDNWAENQKVDYYCNKWEWDSPCEPFNWDKIARFQKGFKDCLQKVCVCGGG